MAATTLLIGLGKGGSALLPYLLANPAFDLVAACDSSPHAVGVVMAKRCGLRFYEDAVHAVRDVTPELVIDATGDASLAGTLYEVRPAGTSVVTGEASRLLWELLTSHEAEHRCELRFNRLLNDMLSGLVVVQDGKMKFINPAFCSMLGYSKREILGHPYRRILADEVKDRDMGYYQSRVDGKGAPEEYDTKVLHVDGSVKEVRIRAHRTDWEGRPASLVIMSDVTQLRELQRDRERFFRFMVHELRAPLSPMVTAVSLLREPEVLADEERSRKLVGLLARSTDRLQSFVNDFLELSRVDQHTISISQKDVDLERIIEEVVQEQRVLSEDKGLSLEVEPWDAFAVRGDGFVIITAVRNLLNNAIKYTDKGGVTIGVDQDDDCFRIRVSDTGAGLSRQEQQNIFQEFGRIKRTGGMKGTGLGLALVKKLVELTGGKVWVESPGKDQGSTFTIELPRVFGQPEEKQPAPGTEGSQQT